MEFEEYLKTKKIDSEAFRKAEPHLWQSWKEEFQQLHPNSFTAQKLYLINPVRRKYQLAVESPVEKDSVKATTVSKSEPLQTPASEVPKPSSKPAIPKPVFKPKPKTD
jgi:hypothetical protein